MTRKHRKTIQWIKKPTYEKSDEFNKKIEIIKKYQINSGCKEYQKMQFSLQVRVPKSEYN